MSELRRLLSVLDVDVRDGGVLDVDVRDGDRSSRLDGLDAMAASVRSTGMDVVVSVAGDAQQLDPSVDLAAYRVIQESLTNVAKHAGTGACATVCLQWTPERLIIDVVDDGNGYVDPIALSLSTGRGLLGLNEQVIAVGGALTAEPSKNEGGFHVSATLPVSSVNVSVTGPALQEPV